MRRRLSMFPRAGTTGAVRNAARALAVHLEGERAVDGLVARLREARRGQVLLLLDELGGVSLPVQDPRQPDAGCDHLVCFAEDDDTLVEAVVPFLAPALVGGGSAVVIATESRLGGILAGLEAVGVSTADARRTGSLRCLEAEATLASLCSDDRIDGDLVSAVLGPVLAEAARSGGEVRVYGEMVALLWARGDVPGTLELEQRWDDLSETHPFSLLCGYPTGVLDPEAPEPGRAVCAGHSGLVLSGSAGAPGS